MTVDKKKIEANGFVKGYRRGQSALARWVLDREMTSFADWQYVLAKLKEISDDERNSI